MQFDVVVIGAGPSGIQAAIHSSRKKATTILVGKIHNSAMYEAHVENYFGVSGTVVGKELLNKGIDQAKSFGCTILEQNVISSKKNKDGFTIIMESNEEIVTKSIVIATGISRIKLNVQGEKEFQGKGVSYCAACDCNFYRDKVVAVVGNESEAAISSELMTKYASKVYWISPKRDVDQALLDKVRESGVEIKTVSLVEINGKDSVESLALSDGTTIDVNGIFIELGGKSSVDLAMELDIFPETDDTIRVDDMCRTSLEGVFACGDITGKPWQIAKAVGQGAVAGTSSANFAKESK